MAREKRHRHLVLKLSAEWSWLFPSPSRIRHLLLSSSLSSSWRFTLGNINGGTLLLITAELRSLLSKLYCFTFWFLSDPKLFPENVVYSQRFCSWNSSKFPSRPPWILIQHDILVLLRSNGSSLGSTSKVLMGVGFIANQIKSNQMAYGIIFSVLTIAYCIHLITLTQNTNTAM